MYLVHVSVHKKETKAQATQHRKGKDTHRCHDCFGGMYGILFSVLSLTLGGPVVVNRIPIVCGHTTIPTTKPFFREIENQNPYLYGLNQVFSSLDRVSIILCTS